MAQYIGTVKRFNNVREFGILGRVDGNNIFARYSLIQAEKGELVEFHGIRGENSPQADAVVPTDATRKAA